MGLVGRWLRVEIPPLLMEQHVENHLWHYNHGSLKVSQYKSKICLRCALILGNLSFKQT